MDSILVTDAPFVVLYYDKVARFVQKNVQGLGTNPVNMLDLRRVRMK
jgi:peptide/nickel transport system substrate-binding protein